MTTIVKAGSARDFLGLIPTLAGYTPVESLCLIPFDGNRTIGVMRFDLPPAGHDLPGFASTVIGLIVRLEQADGVAGVVYSTERDAQSVSPVLKALVPLAEICGLAVKDLLYVAADGWGSAVEGALPRPLDELTPPEVEGVKPPEPGRTQHSATVLPDVPHELVAATLVAVEHMPEGEEGLNRTLDLFEGAATDWLDAEGLALLHWCLQRPSVRDVLIVGWVCGELRGMDAIEAQIRWEDGADYPEELAKIMFGEAPRPEADRLTQALANVRVVARILPEPGTFATAAWLAWALGRSTEADAYAKRALDIDDEHGLGQIVATFVNAGHLPAWAFEPRP